MAHQIEWTLRSNTADEDLNRIARGLECLDMTIPVALWRDGGSEPSPACGVSWKLLQKRQPSTLVLKVHPPRLARSPSEERGVRP